jgi:D-aminopeptidase
LPNIELSVPIGPETISRVASVSKQFTCGAVLMLAADGKLSLDSDTRDWLPQFPDLDQRITLEMRPWVETFLPRQGEPSWNRKTCQWQ